jgi:hypothetical protein
LKARDSNRKKRAEEWDEREKEWTRIMRASTRDSEDSTERASQKDPRLRNQQRKFNPKTRFRRMLISLTVFLVSMGILILTMNNSGAMVQAVLSMFTTLVSGVVFLMNYGKDLVFWIIGYVTRYSLK